MFNQSSFDRYLFPIFAIIINSENLLVFLEHKFREVKLLRQKGYVFVTLTDVANCPSWGLYQFILPSTLYEGLVSQQPTRYLLNLWILANLLGEKWSLCLYLRAKKPFPGVSPADLFSWARSPWPEFCNVLPPKPVIGKRNEMTLIGLNESRLTSSGGVGIGAAFPRQRCLDSTGFC